MLPQSPLDLQAPARERAPGRFTEAAARLGLASVLVGIAGLAGLLAPASVREALAPLGPIQPAPALGIVLAGIAILCFDRPPSERGIRRAGRLAALAAGTLALAALALPGRLEGLAGATFAPMSVPGAVALSFVAVALLQAARERAGRALGAELLFASAAVIGLLALLGSFYGVESLYEMRSVPLAPWPAVGFTLLGVAGLVARPEFSLAQVLTGRSVGAQYLRRAIPTLVGIPLAVGITAMGAARLGVWDRATAFAAFTLVSMAALACASVLNARRIDFLVEERRRLERVSRRVFDNAVVGMAQLAGDGRWLRVNDRLCEILGWPREELLAWGARAAPRIPVDFLRPTLGAAPFEMYLETKDGRPVWLEVAISPERPDSAPTSWIAIVSEVTDRKRAEAERERLLAEAVDARAEAERAGRAKDEFFALISHELRSPLGAITGWLSLLRRPDTPSDVRSRAIDVVERNSLLLTRLIGDLLDASRLASGKLEIERVPFDLLEVVKSAVAAFELMARERGLVLELAADLDSAYVEGDPERIDQVVRNLVGNALKFTPPGGSVVVSLERREDELLVQVQDTGEGIAAEVLPHVFERFRQGDGGARGMERGLGLGLSIVRHLVELHGGRVEAASAGLGLGATLSVWLPAAGGKPLHLALRRAKDGPDMLEGLCILVIGGDRVAVEGWALALEAADAEVVWVLSGAEAIVQTELLNPHVVVADLDHHPADAADLVGELRGASSGRLRAAVAVSTLGTLASRRGARQAGFDGYLARPFDPKLLVALIHSLVTRPTRVLVVDDDVDTADSLALMLSRRGFEVERAGDVDTAREAFERSRPDVVVTDLQLGAASGVDLASALRARGGRLRIIAATGRSREELGGAIELFDGYLRKPIEIDPLLAMLGTRP